MPGKTFHLCLDVRGALRRPNSTLRGFLHDDGRPMKPAEAREALMDELAKGRRVLLVGSSADCPDFDYQTGCPGHATDSRATASEEGGRDG